MDERARTSAWARAAIAFGLAGVLLVVNVVAAVAWRDDRRDRFDGDRIEFHERIGGDRGWNDQGPGEQGGQGFPGGPMGPGAGSGDQGDRGPMGPGGRGADGEGQGSTDPDGSDDDDQTKEGAA